MSHKHEIETLWAPWRMAYIHSEDKPMPVEVGPGADSDCFLCQAVFDESRDDLRHVLRRTERTISVLNKYPYNNGHLLVAPRGHFAKLSDITEAEKLEIVQEIDRWVEILQEKMNPDGFNIGLNLGRSAGAGLPGHVHWHIVPRWNGDTNFMTSVASAKVIPQSLTALWEILRR